VDDGSTDDTYEVVEKWKQEADFLVRYVWQPNKGKHVAFRRGLEQAQGKFFLPFDSDDACVPEALERFKFHWDSIPTKQKPRFSGVCGLCKDQYGRLVGHRFPWDITDSDSLEIYYRYGVKGEKWGFQRSEVLRRYPFPDVEGARYVPEGVVWNAIAKSYKTRFVNEVLRIYFIQNAFSSDQITHSLSDPSRNAAGGVFYYELRLNEEIMWFRFAPWDFFRSAVNYVRFSLHSGMGISRSLRKIQPALAKSLVLFALPLGGALYALEKRNVSVLPKYARVTRAVKGWMANLF
jgi:glycosyltransferase involved in cell wall biosynthesis